MDEASSDVAEVVTKTLVEYQCTILSDTFDVMVQIVMGASAIALLIAKWRCCEKVPRSFWFFFADNSKQCAGFFIAHLGNLVMSQLLESDASPCVWYVVNIFFDSTLRVAMAYAVLRVVMSYFRKKGYHDLVFGEYREWDEYTRSEAFCIWWKQSWIWVAIVACTRAVLGMLFWAFEQPLSDAGTWVLSPLEDYTATHGHDLELIIVMVIIPFSLIAFQLWVQDSFLQADAEGRGGCLSRVCPCCCTTSVEYTRQASTLEEGETEEGNEDCGQKRNVNVVSPSEASLACQSSVQEGRLGDFV